MRDQLLCLLDAMRRKWANPRYAAVMRRVAADGTASPEPYRSTRDRLIGPHLRMTNTVIQRAIDDGSSGPTSTSTGCDSCSRRRSWRPRSRTEGPGQPRAARVHRRHRAGRPGAFGTIGRVPTLILLRHGESDWNQKNLFTGWVDVDLTATGEAEAARAGELLSDAGLLPDAVHTSVLRRAIRTANIALDVADRHWLPVRRSWRLNERHYGALQGKDKSAVRAEFGDEQFMLWRRSYDVPPPPLADDDEYSQAGDPRYADLLDAVPRTECLKDVLGRLLPYWYDAIVPDLRVGRSVLVAAHGNSLRALIKHLDGLSDEAVVELNVPTGIPLHYDLDPVTLRPSRPADVPRPGGGRGRHRGRRQPGPEVVLATASHPDRDELPAGRDQADHLAERGLEVHVMDRGVGRDQGRTGVVRGRPRSRRPAPARTVSRPTPAGSSACCDSTGR